MPITFECQCGKSVTVPDEYAGRSGSCRSCGQRMLVPFLSSGGGIATARAEADWTPAQVKDIGYDDGAWRVVSEIKVENALAHPGPVEAKPRSFRLDPYVACGVGIPALILSVFGFYLFNESKRQEAETAIKALVREGEKLEKSGKPEAAESAYDRVAELARSYAISDDEAKQATSSALNAKERVAQVVQKLRSQRQREAELAAEKLVAKEKAEKEHKDKYAAIDAIGKKYLEQQKILSAFSVDLSGGAFLNLVNNQSELMRGLNIILLPQMVPRSSIDVFLARLHSKTESPVARAQLEFLRESPPEMLIDLGYVYELVRLPIGKKSILPERSKFIIATGDIDWIKLVVSLAVERTKTNIDGKYLLKNLKGGTYYMFALHSTDITHAEWFVPINADKPESIHFDFENGSAAILINRHGD